MLIDDLQDCYKLGMIFFLHLDNVPFSLLTNAYNATIFFKTTWAFLTSALVASITPFILTSNYFVINVWSMVIISPIIIVHICPSRVDSQVCKNTSNMSNCRTIDAPPSSLMDWSVNLKVKIMKRERVGRAPWLVTFWG